MVAQNPQIDAERLEALGPAERVVQQLTTFTDHLVHNRPGLVTKDARHNIGVRWAQACWRKQEDESKHVFLVSKVGKKKTETKVGVLDADGKTVKNDRGQVVGEYRKPGLFPEAAEYLYRQVAEVFKLDNEFAARWASWAFARDHKDTKVILAAFLLVQNRKGDPERDGGEILFYDEDYREVGEAMCLITDKGYLDAKLLNRVGDVLDLPEIAAINRELGFGKSARRPARGRYHKAVHRWLRYREVNPKMLKALVDKTGFRTNILRLAQRSRYKPMTGAFFQALRWKQGQAKDGWREVAIGDKVKAAESWAGMDEKAVCERIVATKPGYKRLVGLLPPEVGFTRAVVASAMEAGSFSNADLVILGPTLEELGLLEVAEFKDRWKAAVEASTNQRAANIAKRMKKKEHIEIAEDGADKAVQKAVAEVMNDLRVIVIVDISGSMHGAIEQAKVCLTKLLVAIPLNRLHVSVFNTAGREVVIKHASSKGVEHAFRGFHAGGGTNHAEGVRALAHHKPKADEDVLVIFVGDEGERAHHGLVRMIQATGWNPVAFGLLKIKSHFGYNIVTDAAKDLGLPCIPVDPMMFEGDDPYAVPRTLRNLIASTPVGQQAAGAPVRKRKTLVQEILETPLLSKPVWATAA
jgi:hypothetical protein